jgi:hypothetical protein
MMKPLSTLFPLLLAVALGSGCILTPVDTSPPPPFPGPMPRPSPGTLPTYATCGGFESCAAFGDVCVGITTPDSSGGTRVGAQCSSFCGTDLDCAPANGFDGACYMLSSDPDFRDFTCYARCTSDSQCGRDQECVEVAGAAGPDAICLPRLASPPPPTAATYDPCLVASDCSASNVCVRVITTDSSGVTRDGQQCSTFCAADSACQAINGYAGACYMISSDPDFRNFTCYARCDTDADCDFTQDCVSVDGPAGPDAICLPAI